jgi:hypothetical protein
MVQQGSKGSKVQNYLDDRWQKQRDYYSKQARWNKFWHQWLLAFGAVGAVLVPVLLNLPQVPVLIVTILSLLVSIVIALDSIFHYGDNWKVFRQTTESLKRERILFDNQLDPYDDLDAEKNFAKFVIRCEEITNLEGKQYFEIHKLNEKLTSGPSF